jgi:hypothetical protein
MLSLILSFVLVSYRFKNTFEELVSIFRINLNKIGEFLFCASHYIHKVLFNMCQINTRVFVTSNVLYVGITDLNETAGRSDISKINIITKVLRFYSNLIKIIQ